MQKSLSRYWLLLGVTALAIAGLFSLVLVVARTPSLEHLPLFADFFHKALVVHVDLSVLIWFLCIACMMWSLQVGGAKQAFPYLEESALICFALGTLAIALSPLDTGGQALMSNYIPVLKSPVFFLGLGLLMSGTFLMLMRFLTSTWQSDFTKTIQFGLFSAALITLIALSAFIWSYHQMPREIEQEQYFELTFWGGGHLLQFLHAQILMVCWLLLMQRLIPTFTAAHKVFYALFGIGLLCAFASPVAYLASDVNSAFHRMFFTHLMIAANGIAPVALGLWLLPGVWKQRSNSAKALWSALTVSILLFIYGGVLGGLIQGQNVVIPAHYHGSIVGITLAFMGAAYLMLPRFGYRDPSVWKLAYWQPIVYGGGQLMHISGLAWSGGYGVLRKTPGGLDALPFNIKAAMGFMGLGGTIAIVGGFMFVIVVWKSVRKI